MSECGNSGGVGIHAGHECLCPAEVGHAKVMGFDHGCPCGALWNDRISPKSGEAK